MGTWLAVAALIVAVIAIPATIWGTRQWGNRRARVEFSFVAVPLLPEDTGNGLLEVTYRDIPVKNPHLVTVTLRNAGPRDISSATFDEGHPITIGFSQTFYGLTSVQGGAHIVSAAIGTPAKDDVVRLEPSLLKRADEWSFSAVVTGPVEVSINAPLVDTDVVRALPEADYEPSGIVVRLNLPFVSAEVPLRRRGLWS